MDNLLPDLPSGPLDEYRKKASFNWKRLRILLDTEEGVKFQNRLSDEIKKYPEFFENAGQTLTLDEERRVTIKKMFLLKRIYDMIEGDMSDPHKRLLSVYTIYPFDSTAAVKEGLVYSVFTVCISLLGTERHKHIINDCLNGNIKGSLCLTEIAHGSNIKNLRTIATYKQESKQFVLHTPDFQAAKCWAGSLGQTATHSVVFAQLVMPDGTNEGIHGFLIKVRDPLTHLPYPGVTIFDMGEKIGLNGVDNGCVIFNQYCVPRESLLNKISEVTEEGLYMSLFSDPNKRFGASLGNLSDGRVGITAVGTSYLIKAITIAIRYAAVRRQFSVKENEIEVPILEYQSHQHRLLPYLSIAYNVKVFCLFLFDIYIKFNESVKNTDLNTDLMKKGLEIHAMSSASKAYVGWTVRDAIQECREACAGHGYLKVAGLGDLRNAHDPSCTFEGENHVLIQQTSNWLLKLWQSVEKGQKISTPYNSVEYFNNAKTILNSKFGPNVVEEMIEPKHILNTFKWLVCYLSQATYSKYKRICESLKGSQDVDIGTCARNETQVFYAKTLSVAYIQHVILDKMNEAILKTKDVEIKNVLLKLFSLFGVWCLEKHIATLYIGGYATSPKAASLIQESILKLCKDVKDDAVSMVDAIAHPDFVINSVLGYSDGQVYKHLEAAILQNPGAFSRPSWWKEIAYGHINTNSKL